MRGVGGELLLTGEADISDCNDGGQLGAGLERVALEGLLESWEDPS